MAMPLFYLDESSRLVVSPSLWIYIAVAIPLTVVTLAYWRVSLMQKRRERKGDGQAGMNAKVEEV